MAANSKEGLTSDMPIPPHILDDDGVPGHGKGRRILRVALLLSLVGIISYLGYLNAPALMNYLSSEKKKENTATKKHLTQQYQPNARAQQASLASAPAKSSPIPTAKPVHPSKRIAETSAKAKPKIDLPAPHVSPKQVESMVSKQREIKNAKLERESFQAKNEELEQKIQYQINEKLLKIVESDEFGKLAKQNPQLLMTSTGKGGGKANPINSLLLAMQGPNKPVEVKPEIIVPEYGEGPQVKMVYADEPPKQALIYYKGQKLFVEEGRKVGDIQVERINRDGVDFIFKGKRFSRTVTTSIMTTPDNSAAVGNVRGTGKKDYPGSEKAPAGRDTRELSQRR
jgi:hypothetical protein